MKVSVIIPVYKAEAYVAEAVASALAQPEVGEVLLIEDGSQGSVCTLGISMRRPVLAGAWRDWRGPGPGRGGRRCIGGRRDTCCRWIGSRPGGARPK